MRKKGRILPLSLPRRLVGDLLHFAKKIPTIPVQRRMNVADLRDLRQQASPRPSWCAIFTKAYSIVASAFPELRRAYVSFPWPHLYEHPTNIASIAIERDYHGENGVFFVHLRSPGEQSLTALDAHLRRFKEQPIESIALYRRALLISRLPLPVRRFIWWYGLNSSGCKRCKRMGTFGVSSYASLGAESLHPISPLTVTLNYGVIDEEGNVNVRLIYDHRVLDGATIARALEEMENILHKEIADELSGQRSAVSGQQSAVSYKTAIREATDADTQ